ncbi:DUF982 domain-containing protein [Mesorhizobium sp. AR10]|uniref:DUF982 domain-containing protein n=1 Tax=Mesorhizobium sp. AR10 TaxID=2865839 RepID=UPI00215F49ED|nr:DUF982 domain-containing protein [Mesorhizobium sp. AR10]UVK40544.1 DUF982 domain-containing protein [Mesorhizobium sp. AR10]
MRDEQFDVSVTIESEPIGSLLTVTGTVQAASLLLDKWPDESRGPKYRSALKAQMDAMEQRRAVGTARRAFTAAAREASVFVSEGQPSR